MDWNKKVAVITGASSGIGKATRDLLHGRGAVVYDLDRVGGGDRFLSCDVRSTTQVRQAIDHVIDREGRIDMLFANAGMHLVATLEATTDEQLDEVIDINIKGVFRAMRAVVPHMRKQGQGSIVLMGSDQCFVGKGASAVYGLTKGAVGQLTKSSAIDLAPHGIRVNCICPGSIDTPLLHRAVHQFAAATQRPEADILEAVGHAQPIARLGRPEEIAAAVAFLLSDESSFMTGALLSADGGYVCQ